MTLAPPPGGPPALVNYFAEPTATLFHEDSSRFRCLIGPFASGKTSACIMELLIRSKLQAPMTVNGVPNVRPTKWVVVRNTAGDLLRTTIPSWKQWIPEQVCPITRGAVIHGDMNLPLDDGTTASIEIIFLGMDQPKDLRHALSLEVTGAFFNEIREIPRLLVQAILDRTGRFPPVRWGPVTFAGAIADTNPPDTEHWLYRWAELGEWQDPATLAADMAIDDAPRLNLIETRLRAMGRFTEPQIKETMQYMTELSTRQDQFTYKFFRQPPALLRLPNSKDYVPNPKAENVANVPGGYDYWYKMIANRDPEYIKVFVMGEYGSTFEGRPVYDGVWDSREHVSDRPLALMQGIPLRLAFDFGLTPACVIAQLSPMGQMRILRSLLCERGALREFLRDSVIPLLRNEFPNMAIITTGDPAGAAMDQAAGIDCFSELKAQGLPAIPAITNDFILRRKSVISFLTRRIGDQPGFIVDPSCKHLIKGFNGGYRFSRVLVRQRSGEDTYREKPDKNEWSHDADCVQYLCAMAEGGIAGMFEPRGNAAPTAIPSPTSWKGFV